MCSARRLQWTIDCVTRGPRLGDHIKIENHFCEIIILYDDLGEDCFYIAPEGVQGFLASLIGPDGTSQWPHAMPREIVSVMQVDYHRMRTPHGVIIMPYLGQKIYDPDPGGPLQSKVIQERDEGADWHPRAGSWWDRRRK